jgi:scyllo-inositol 2-dehydrogenase (NADP+)
MIDKIQTAEKIEVHYTDGTVEQLTVDHHDTSVG